MHRSYSAVQRRRFAHRDPGRNGGVTNVEDKPAAVLEEVGAGRSGRTPFLAMGGVMLVICTLFLVALALAVLAYVLA
jgi:hypothetical protein